MKDMKTDVYRFSATANTLSMAGKISEKPELSPLAASNRAYLRGAERVAIMRFACRSCRPSSCFMSSGKMFTTPRLSGIL